MKPCQNCGMEIRIRACGERTPCPHCRTPYPHGDCSDLDDKFRKWEPA